MHSLGIYAIFVCLERESLRSTGNTAHYLVLLLSRIIVIMVKLNDERDGNDHFVDASPTFRMNEGIGFRTNVARVSTFEVGCMIKPYNEERSNLQVLASENNAENHEVIDLTCKPNITSEARNNLKGLREVCKLHTSMHWNRSNCFSFTRKVDRKTVRTAEILFMPSQSQATLSVKPISHVMAAFHISTAENSANFVDRTRQETERLQSGSDPNQSAVARLRNDLDKLVLRVASIFWRIFEASSLL